MSRSGMAGIFRKNAVDPSQMERRQLNNSNLNNLNNHNNHKRFLSSNNDSTPDEFFQSGLPPCHPMVSSTIDFGGSEKHRSADNVIGDGDGDSDDEDDEEKDAQAEDEDDQGSSTCVVAKKKKSLRKSYDRWKNEMRPVLSTKPWVPNGERSQEKMNPDSPTLQSSGEVYDINHCEKADRDDQVEEYQGTSHTVAKSFDEILSSRSCQSAAGNGGCLREEMMSDPSPIPILPMEMDSALEGFQIAEFYPSSVIEWLRDFGEQVEDVNNDDDDDGDQGSTFIAIKEEFQKMENMLKEERQPFLSSTTSEEYEGSLDEEMSALSHKQDMLRKELERVDDVLFASFVQRSLMTDSDDESREHGASYPQQNEASLFVSMRLEHSEQRDNPLYDCSEVVYDDQLITPDCPHPSALSEASAQHAFEILSENIDLHSDVGGDSQASVASRHAPKDISKTIKTQLNVYQELENIKARLLAVKARASPNISTYQTLETPGRRALDLLASDGDHGEIELSHSTTPHDCANTAISPLHSLWSHSLDESTTMVLIEKWEFEDTSPVDSLLRESSSEERGSLRCSESERGNNDLQYAHLTDISSGSIKDRHTLDLIMQETKASESDSGEELVAVRALSVANDPVPQNFVEEDETAGDESITQTLARINLRLHGAGDFADMQTTGSCISQMALENESVSVALACIAQGVARGSLKHADFGSCLNLSDRSLLRSSKSLISDQLMAKAKNMSESNEARRGTNKTNGLLDGFLDYMGICGKTQTTSTMGNMEEPAKQNLALSTKDVSESAPCHSEYPFTPRTTSLMGSGNISSLQENIDIFVTCLSHNPPTLPLREELAGIGVELILHSPYTHEEEREEEVHVDVEFDEIEPAFEEQIEIEEHLQQAGQKRPKKFFQPSNHPSTAPYALPLSPANSKRHQFYVPDSLSQPTSPSALIVSPRAPCTFPLSPANSMCYQFYVPNEQLRRPCTHLRVASPIAPVDGHRNRDRPPSTQQQEQQQESLYPTELRTGVAIRTAFLDDAHLDPTACRIHQPTRQQVMLEDLSAPLNDMASPSMSPTKPPWSTSKSSQSSSSLSPSPPPTVKQPQGRLVCNNPMRMLASKAPPVDELEKERWQRGTKEEDDDDDAEERAVELLNCNEKLLQSMVDIDYPVYQALTSQDMTGVPVGGVLPGCQKLKERSREKEEDFLSQAGHIQVRIVNPTVRFLSNDMAVVTYTRIDHLIGGRVARKWDETRIWERQQRRQPDGEDVEGGATAPWWVNCHFHQSIH